MGCACRGGGGGEEGSGIGEKGEEGVEVGG